MAAERHEQQVTPSALDARDTITSKDLLDLCITTDSEKTGEASLLTLCSRTDAESIACQLALFDYTFDFKARHDFSNRLISVLRETMSTRRSTFQHKLKAFLFLIHSQGRLEDLFQIDMTELTELLKHFSQQGDPQTSASSSNDSDEMPLPPQDGEMLAAFSTLLFNGLGSENDEACLLALLSMEKSSEFILQMEQGTQASLIVMLSSNLVGKDPNIRLLAVMNLTHLKNAIFQLTQDEQIAIVHCLMNLLKTTDDEDILPRTMHLLTILAINNDTLVEAMQKHRFINEDDLYPLKPFLGVYKIFCQIEADLKPVLSRSENPHFMTWMSDAAAGGTASETELEAFVSDHSASI